jgi:drug/metabolite transporter (DMT)-like permease
MDAYTGEIASALCALLWATALTLFRKTGEVVSPLALNVFKNTIVLPLVALTMWVTGSPFFPAYDTWTYGLLALSGVVGIAGADTLVFASLNRIGAGWTAVVNCAYSPSMVLLAWVAFAEPITAAVAGGALLVAIAVTLAPGRLNGGPRHQGGGFVFGLILGVLSVVVNAASAIVLKYPIAGHPPPFETTDLLFLTFYRLLCGSAVILLWQLLRRDRRKAFAFFRPSPVWKVMLPGSFLGSYLAMIIWLFGMQQITGSIARAAILNQTTAIYLPIFGVIFLGERFTRRKVAAVLIAFAGATIVILGR